MTLVLEFQPDLYGFPPDLEPPAAWMGGKRRFSKRIWDWMANRPGVRDVMRDGFTDLCCGGGSLTFEALHRGVPIERCLMVDAGPWGTFWEAIARDVFDLAQWHAIIRAIPDDPWQVKPWLDSHWQNNPPQHGTWLYWWLILQQGSFGGKPLNPDLETGRWGKGVAMAPHWEDPADPSRIKRTLPNMGIINRRLEACVSFLSGRIQARRTNIDHMVLPSDGIVYVDPPYEDTETRGYVGMVDLARVTRCGTHVFISEAKPLPGATETIRLTDGTNLGSVNAKRKVTGHDEWLSWYAPGAVMPTRGVSPG